MLETQGASMQGASSPITDWINSDVKKANTISIIMIIFAAWAGIEAISNVAGIEIPPETGMATNVDPDDTQRTNNGVIVGLGAVLGTVGIIIQMSIPRGAEEEEIVEEGPKFDEDLVKLTKWLCSRGTTTAQFFDWADVDNSGSIDMVELANALRQSEIANLPPWEIEELVKIMDINSDGRINLPELDIMLTKIQNTLGIEFVPYVEEEQEESEEEPEAEAESQEVAEEVEDATEDETEEAAEDTEEDAAEEAEEETEAETEEVAEETEEDATEEAEEESEAETEDDAEEAEDDAEEEESEDETEEVAEETEEEATEEAEDDSAEEESDSDDSGEEVADEDSNEDSETEIPEEPVVEEIPKKKKKF